MTLRGTDTTANPAPFGLAGFEMTTVLLNLHNAGLKKIAGIEGIICGVFAIYAATAQILNEVYGRTILPLGVSSKNN